MIRNWTDEELEHLGTYTSYKRAALLAARPITGDDFAALMDLADHKDQMGMD
jgi:hypothetical protein